MQKIYIDDVKASEYQTKSPSLETLNSILAFSKSIEVLKSKKKNVEIILN